MVLKHLHYFITFHNKGTLIITLNDHQLFVTVRLFRHMPLANYELKLLLNLFIDIKFTLILPI